MRPRPDAAENASSQFRFQVSQSGFNEAAARCRGKRAFTAADRGVAGLQ